MDKNASCATDLEDTHCVMISGYLQCAKGFPIAQVLGPVCLQALQTSNASNILPSKLPSSSSLLVCADASTHLGAGPETF